MVTKYPDAHESLGLNELTHWGRKKKTCKMHFLEWKCLNFDIWGLIDNTSALAKKMILFTNAYKWERTAGSGPLPPGFNPPPPPLPPPNFFLPTRPRPLFFFFFFQNSDFCPWPHAPHPTPIWPPPTAHFSSKAYRWINNTISIIIITVTS